MELPASGLARCGRQPGALRRFHPESRPRAPAGPSSDDRCTGASVKYLAAFQLASACLRHASSPPECRDTCSWPTRPACLPDLAHDTFPQTRCRQVKLQRASRNPDDHRQLSPSIPRHQCPRLPVVPRRLHAEGTSMAAIHHGRPDCKAQSRRRAASAPRKSKCQKRLPEKLEFTPSARLAG